MSSPEAGEPLPAAPLLSAMRLRKPRRVISDLYRKRVERMFDLYCESVDEEMYWRPETWTLEFKRRFARVMSRMGAVGGGADDR